MASTYCNISIVLYSVFVFLCDIYHTLFKAFKNQRKKQESERKPLTTLLERSFHILSTYITDFPIAVTVYATTKIPAQGKSRKVVA